jgi:hypothetical protein
VVNGNNVQRVFRSETVVALQDAPHWRMADKQTGEFLTNWADLSHRILEAYHMLLVDLHMADVLDAAQNFGGKKSFDGDMSVASAAHAAELIKWYKAENKSVHTKSNKFDTKNMEHAGLFVTWLRDQYENCFNKFMGMDTKNRILATPHRYNANGDHVVQMSSNITFNKAKTADTDTVRAMWDEVINWHLLSMHRAKQYGEEEYEHRGEAWSLDLKNKLLETQWPDKCNVAAAEVIDDMVQRGVIPAGNGTIVLKDSSGMPLKSANDKNDLSVFEACCAFGTFSNSRWQKNYGDAALALVDLRVHPSGTSAVYYGTVTGLQCVLPAQFVNNVLRGTWWAGHRNEGQPTDPPAFVNPFDNMALLMRNATRIGSGVSAGSVADQAVMAAKTRTHDPSFVNYV